MGLPAIKSGVRLCLQKNKAPFAIKETARLYYDEYGDKNNPTILLLHGAGALDTFSGQYGFFDQYHLIVPHLPGAGKAVHKAYEPKKVIKELIALIESEFLHKGKIGVIGHSLGGQIAVMLVSRRPELFQFAVFLSAWVNPSPKTVQTYCALAGLSVKMLHWKWLVRLQAKYWNYTTGQADFMVEYMERMTPQVYRSFFAKTLDLSKLPGYLEVTVPMLAVCGAREVKDMKISLKKLAQNPNCRTVMLQRAGHDFPMRNARQLNPMLLQFILAITKICQ